MNEKILAESHSLPTISVRKATVVSGEKVEDQKLPAGYKITKDGVSLEIKRYIKSKAICYCSACGQVVPALKSFTPETFSNWLDRHISLFQEKHRVNHR